MAESIAKVLIACFLFWGFTAAAQEHWPSPEVEQMFQNAQENAARGNYKDAITTYKHAMTLAPGQVVLYREMGRAQYMAQSFKEAEATLLSAKEMKGADAVVYQLLALSEEAQGHSKEAMKTLDKGLLLFPSSGSLYYDKGRLYYNDSKDKEALQCWIDGIKADPGYAANYGGAAGIYLETDKVMWGLIYGETYLAIRQDTTEDEHMKERLYAGYKKLFDNLPETKKDKPANFEEAYTDIYLSLTPVVSDGISTENLTMARTRFLMEWTNKYGKQYPLKLFAYHDSLIRNGFFDIYNEWLFGKAESVTEYKAWTIFHEGDMERLLKWKSEHFPAAAANEYYNTTGTDGLFTNKKSKKHPKS